jgi:hypothetical protein
MTTGAVEERNQRTIARSYASRRDQEIENLADAPTGAPMEGRHWLFLFVSGVGVPVLILLWGWA